MVTNSLLVIGSRQLITMTIAGEANRTDWVYPDAYDLADVVIRVPPGNHSVHIFSRKR